jgi:DNA-binding MarR family transcriptional regulator
MPQTDPAKLWSLNYRLLMSVISSVAPDIAVLGLETKELFILAEVDEHPYPAELAATLCMPKPTVTVNLKRLEAAGLLRREIDSAEGLRHRPRHGRRVTWIARPGTSRRRLRCAARYRATRRRWRAP